MDPAQVRLEATYIRTGSFIQGTVGSRCDGYRITLKITSDEAEDRIREVVRMAHQSCFTESALEAPVPIERMTELNGQTLSV